MKLRITIVSATLFGMLSMFLVIPGAFAQNASARVDIPFTFTANNQVLPAGCYRVKFIMPGTFIGLINCATSKTAGVMVHTGNGFPAIRRGSLVFRVTAHGYRLIQVRFPNTNLQSDLSVQQSRAEREQAANDSVKTTEIAMN